MLFKANTKKWGTSEATDEQKSAASKTPTKRGDKKTQSYVYVESTQNTEVRVGSYSPKMASLGSTVEQGTPEITSVKCISHMQKTQHMQLNKKGSRGENRSVRSERGQNAVPKTKRLIPRQGRIEWRESKRFKPVASVDGSVHILGIRCVGLKININRE